jgi:hypothetical protein
MLSAIRAWWTRDTAYTITAWYPTTGERLVITACYGLEKATAKARELNHARRSTTHVYEVRRRDV